LKTWYIMHVKQSGGSEYIIQVTDWFERQLSEDIEYHLRGYIIDSNNRFMPVGEVVSFSYIYFTAKGLVEQNDFCRSNCSLNLVNVLDVIREYNWLERFFRRDKEN